MTGTIAIIPARGGSKGIPKKNIIELAGKPLITFTIKAAINSKVFDKIVVSSDDEDILRVSSEAGAVVHLRPEHLALDHVSSNPVITNVLEIYNQFSTVCLLQPTSPLRNSNHITNSYNLFLKKSPCSLISVYIPEEHPLKAFILGDDGKLTGAYSDSAPFTRRQDLPDVFLPNGAIYIFSKESFLKENTIPVNNIVPFIMDTRESIDIDSLFDLKIAELILEGRL